MSLNQISNPDQYDGTLPVPSVAVFHLQGVCVRVQRGMRGRLRTAGLEVSPDIEAVFRWLHKRQVRIVLLSDYTLEETTILLKRLRWFPGSCQLIEAVVVNCTRHNNPIQRALEVVSPTQPGAAIVVVDTPGLLEASARCHILFGFGVTTGRSSYQELQTTPCSALLDGPVYLINHLVGLVPELARLR